MQIFHRNNARIVRAQTVVKAFENAMANHNRLGEVQWVRTFNDATPYQAQRYDNDPRNGLNIRRVKSGKRIVRRVNCK